MHKLGDAIVIGGSIAGLVAARILSDYFEDVTSLERDEIENRREYLLSTRVSPMICAMAVRTGPQTRGERPVGIKERALYFAALDRLQVGDQEIRRLMTEVFHLVRPLSALMEEPLRNRVRAQM